MEKRKTDLELGSALDRSTPLLTRVLSLTTIAKTNELTRSEQDLITLTLIVEAEVEARHARITQRVFQDAMRGWKNSYCTFRDEPVSRDVDFDRSILRQINTALSARLVREGFDVVCEPETNTILTDPPSPDYEYWSEVGYLESSFKLSW